MTGDKDKNQYILLADLTTMGIAMAISIILGLSAGIFIDNRFGTEPLYTLLLLFCGIIAGFRIMYKVARRYLNEENKHDQNG